jgi:two-component system CheB/CheR fusion protein
MASKRRSVTGARKKPSKDKPRGAEPVTPKSEHAANDAAAKATPPAQSPDDRQVADFLVVGVGASAGGLEALNELLQNVQQDGLALIVVQHLAPDHESILTQLLARSAHIPVVTAVDGMVIERNRIYVTPPNVELAVLHGVIRTMTPVGSHGPRLPVDYLFRSLAEDQGRAAVGVVLSGTGSDGTLGLSAIKAAGGYAFAQDPSTAKYDGMPRSALASGAADYSLAPKDIAGELARIARRHGYRSVDRTAPELHVQNQLSKLFVLIRSEFGNDLSQYKASTIDRRIERRMTLRKIGRLEDYVRFAQKNRDELTALYKDVLITVTRFFRDAPVFETLKKEVLPALFEHKDPAQPVRVWVSACATGEEAYSIAICLLEYCEEKGVDDRIQVFGTDIDDDAIQVARTGLYPSNIAADVSPERLNRFFAKRDDSYVISRRIRDMLVFSHQNILNDAPFSRMDMVSCRNLLIYLQSPAQKRVLRVLHYALNPSGYLLLGASESLGDSAELFASIDRKSKIFVKRAVATQVPAELGFGAPAMPEPMRETQSVRPTSTLRGLADRKVLELYGPAGVVVNENLEILQFRGRTGPFLEPAPGAASFNLLKLARYELHIELKKAIQKATKTQARVTSDVTFHEERKEQFVRLDVVPLQDPESRSHCFLVTFQKLAPPKEVVVSVRRTKGADAPPARLTQRVQTLERELAETKEYLQTTIEEKEGALEELQGANEELQSSNEELQSTNEELETSKEEMQSTNEELTTVNEELQNRMAELSQSNDDLHNVLVGVDNAIIIVGMDFKTRRFTNAAERLFHLVAGDVGRRIAFLDPFLGTATALEAKVSDVIQTLSTFEQDILASNKRWYQFRIMPYKSLDHAIRGALLTFIDIDVRKRSEEMTRDVGAYADRFLAAISHPLLIVDPKLRVVWANAPFFSYFQLSADETLGAGLQGLGAKQFAIAGLRERLDKVFASSSIFRDYAVRVTQPDGSSRMISFGGSLVPASADAPLVLLSIEPAVRAESQTSVSPAAMSGR